MSIDNIEEIETDTDDMATEPQLEPTSADAFEKLFVLARLIAHEGLLKKRVRELQRVESRALAAQQQLTAARAAHAEQVARDRAAIAAQQAALAKRQADVEVAEGRLEEREKHYVELPKQWGNLKLPSHTFFGSLSRQESHTAIEKARFATEHGRLPEPHETLESVRVGREGTTLSQQLPRADNPMLLLAPAPTATAVAVRVRPRHGGRRLGAS